MRQRLGLAAALLGDPKILVLDEPANGLDPQGIRWLRDFLRHLAGQGRAIVVSSHLLSEIAQTVDDVVVIADGRLVTHAPLHQLTDTRGPRVRIRTPEPEAMAAAIRTTPIRLIARDGQELLVAGAGQEVIGRLAFERGVVLYGLAAETDSLEDIFLTLTTANHAEEAHR